MCVLKKVGHLVLQCPIAAFPGTTTINSQRNELVYGFFGGITQCPSLIANINGMKITIVRNNEVQPIEQTKQSIFPFCMFRKKYKPSRVKANLNITL